MISLFYLDAWYLYIEANLTKIAQVVTPFFSLLLYNGHKTPANLQPMPIIILFDLSRRKMMRQHVQANSSISIHSSHSESSRTQSETRATANEHFPENPQSLQQSGFPSPLPKVKRNKRKKKWMSYKKKKNQVLKWWHKNQKGPSTELRSYWWQSSLCQTSSRKPNMGSFPIR